MNTETYKLFDEFWDYISTKTPAKRQFVTINNKSVAVYNAMEVEVWKNGLKDKLFLLREAVLNE